MTSSIIESALRKRAGRLLDPKAVADILGQPFILAGGAMRPAEPRDYDIFGYDRPIDLSEVERRCRERTDITVIVETDNAVTAECKGHKYIIVNGSNRGGIVHSESCPCKNGGVR